MIAAAALVWAAFIALFGWGGAVLSIWPATLIGAGGALAIAQLAEVAKPHLAPRSIARGPYAK